jgi:hypothetical protein
MEDREAQPVGLTRGVSSASPLASANPDAN